MPKGADALDLTHCILHHLTHPDQQWFYLDNHDELLEEIGGQNVVQEYQYDREIVNRREAARLEYQKQTKNAKLTLRQAHTHEDVICIRNVITSTIAHHTRCSTIKAALEAATATQPKTESKILLKTLEKGKSGQREVLISDLKLRTRSKLLFLAEMDHVEQNDNEEEEDAGDEYTNMD